MECMSQMQGEVMANKKKKNEHKKYTENKGDVNFLFVLCQQKCPNWNILKRS